MILLDTNVLSELMRPAILEEAIGLRETRVVLAAAHLDHDPRHNRCAT